MGARKAKIRARRAALREAVESVLGKKRCDVRLERPSLGREEAPRRPAEKVSPAAREESVAAPAAPAPEEARKEVAPAEERPARKDEKAEKSEKTERAEKPARADKAERQEKPAENARQPRGRGRGRDQARAAAAAEAPADPQQFAARAVEGMWRELGGKLGGVVREGRVPAGLSPAFVAESPALGEVVRDINKYSNNVMTQQVFLTLGLEQAGVGSMQTANEAVARWWSSRWGVAERPVVDNGAGLSREARISAHALGRMLQSAWLSPVMPEFVASLPIAGVDGTLRRSKAQASAHLKTGSLRDSNALAGYVDGVSGKRYVLVAFVNHANAGAAPRPSITGCPQRSGGTRPVGSAFSLVTFFLAKQKESNCAAGRTSRLNPSFRWTTRAGLWLP